MFSPRFTFFAKKVAGGYTPFAVVFNTPTTSTYTVPTGATSMKAWVIGGGGGGESDFINCQQQSDGSNGGESVKTYTVAGGGTVSYTVGSAGVAGSYTGNPSADATDGGNSTVTYSSTTITATGGAGGYNPNHPGTGSGGDFNHAYDGADYPSSPVTRNTAITTSGNTPSTFNNSIGYKGNGTTSGSTNGKPGGVVLYFT